MRTQLPVITGKPFKPSLTIINKRWTREIPCNGTQEYYGEYSRENKQRECTRTCYETCVGFSGPHPIHDCGREHTYSVDVEPNRRNGAGWLERKANGEVVYHTPWIKNRRPFAMPDVRARQETAEKALARLKKEYTMDADAARSCVEQVGRNVADGYYVVATNGHWALLEKGEGNNPAKGSEWLGATKGYFKIVLDNPELHNAIKRAKTMMNERSKAIGLIGLTDTIGVYSECDAGEFTETVGENVYGSITMVRPWHTQLSYEYIEPLLGYWPMAMWFKDEKSAVV